MLTAGSRTCWNWTASPAGPGSLASAPGPCASTRASACVPWAGTPAGRACGSPRPPAGRPHGWTCLWGAGQEAARSGSPVPTCPVLYRPLKVTPQLLLPFPGSLRSRVPSGCASRVRSSLKPAPGQCGPPEWCPGSSHPACSPGPWGPRTWIRRLTPAENLMQEDAEGPDVGFDGVLPPGERLGGGPLVGDVAVTGKVDVLLQSDMRSGGHPLPPQHGQAGDQVQWAGVRRPGAEPVSTVMSRPHVTTRGRPQAPPCGCGGTGGWPELGSRGQDRGARVVEPAVCSDSGVRRDAKGRLTGRPPADKLEKARVALSLPG